MASSEETIVQAILADLTDRRGLKSEWKAIDPELREGISMVWQECASIVLRDKHLPKGGPRNIARVARERMKAMGFSV